MWKFVNWAKRCFGKLCKFFTGTGEKVLAAVMHEKAVEAVGTAISAVVVGIAEMIECHCVTLAIVIPVATAIFVAGALIGAVIVIGKYREHKRSERKHGEEVAAIIVLATAAA